MKRVIGLATGIILLAVTGVIGKAVGAFESFAGIFAQFNGKALLTAVASVLLLYVLEQAITLLTGCVKPKSHRSGTALSVFKSLLKYAFVLLALCAVLTAFGADVTTVVAGVGILALVIGFGAESLIADVITGLFSIMENQYNVGDIVEVNGFRGTISNIGIRTTSITDMGGNTLIVNNSNMKNVLNRSDRSSHAVCVFAIPYETDLEKLEQQLPALLDSIYAAHKDSMKAAPRYLGVDELADSSVNLKFVAEVDEAKIHEAGRVLNRDLFVGMRKLGIEVPYPHMDVHTT